MRSIISYLIFSSFIVAVPAHAGWVMGSVLTSERRVLSGSQTALTARSLKPTIKVFIKLSIKSYLNMTTYRGTHDSFAYRNAIGRYYEYYLK